MRVGAYDFRPGGLPTLATLLLLPGLIGLGLWQLDRAESKRAVETTYQQRENQPPIPLEEALATETDRRYLRVAAAGHYDAEHQFLLDNQVRHGRAGYRVLTPFGVEGAAHLLLVDRGWIPMGASRDALPSVSVSPKHRSVRGVLAPPPATGLVLGPSDTPAPHWPRVVERVEVLRIADQLGRALLPEVLLLDEAEPDGYLREWAPPRLASERHIGYAIQWFALAGLLLLLYLRHNLHRCAVVSAPSDLRRRAH